MKVKTKHRILELTACKTFLSQLRGLMCRKINNDGLLFIFKQEQEVDLHMFFVFYTIDIMYVNEEKKIIEIKRNIKPFTPYIKSPKAKYILEIKSADNIKEGEKLRFL